MRRGPRRLMIGTRGSPLALAQAREFRDRLALAERAPGTVELLVVRTTGDAIQDRALSEAGGKGLFTKELDAALIAGDIDAAVHSAKDLPTVLPPDLFIAGFLPREDVRDVLIAPRARSVADLRRGAVVGSASLRRQAQLRRLRPDLHIRLLRGNVETRLRKVASGEYDATMLALAGLKRLGLDHHAAAILDEQEFLPAVGQGAIAVVARARDLETVERLAPIFDGPTGVAVTCERAFLAVLDGSCRTPIAGHARIDGDAVVFRGLVLAPDGSDSVETDVRGTAGHAASLGEAAGRDVLGRAPAHVLAPFRIVG